MSDYELPELPSDEELGIAGMEQDDDEAAGDRGGGDAPSSSSAPPPGGPGRKEPRSRPREEPPSRPVRRWRGPLTLALLVVTAWLTSPARSLPDPVAATAPDTSFSSARGMVRLVELARRAHPPGSPEHARVRTELLDALRELGLEPRVQTATSWVRRGETLRAATVRNVLARIPGTEPTGGILLTAHYDGRTLSPAAGDDASGVVAILETLRALRAGAPLRNDVLVLLTDGEELDLLGARAFVRSHPWMDDVSVVLSVEMRGGGGPSIMFETGPDNGWIVEALRAGDARPMANSLSYEVYRRLPHDTDFTPFREAGKQGLNFAGIGRGRVYHQTFDTPENVQEATLQHHGVHLLSMVRELGARDLSTVDGPDRVFFRLPVLGLVTYATLWVPVLGVVLLLGTVAVVLWGHRKGAGAGSLVAGLLLGLVTVTAAAGVGWALFRWVRGLHPEYGLLQGSAFHSEGWYVLAATAVSFTLVTGLFGVARRRASLAGLAAGALALPLVGALFLTFAAPLAAMNLQWPALAGVVGVATVIGVAGPRPPGLVRWVLAMVPAAVVVAFLEPLTELVWLAMSVSILPVLAALTAAGFLLLVPLLDTLVEPNRWWAPLTGLILAGAFLGIGLLHAPPSPERPTPSTLAYTLDRQSGEARWASRPGPGLEWARGRAGALDVEAGLEAFLAGGGPFLTSPAPMADLDPPEASTTTGGSPEAAGAGAEAPTDTAGADTTRADASGAPADPAWTRVALLSRIGAELVTVRPAPDSPLRWRALNGERIGGAPPTVIAHWGTPEGALLLDLEAPPGADSVRLEVVEHHLRPGELVGEEAFRRPPDLAPAVDPPTGSGGVLAGPGGISDRALIRTVVTLPVTPGPAGAAGPGATDTAGVAPDTGTAVPDSGGAVPDTGTAVPDSGRVGPDTGSAVPDSGRTVPDSSGVVPDSGRVGPDSGAAVPDGGAVVSDTGAAVPDGGGGGPDRSTVVPDSGAAVPDGGAVVSDNGGGGPDSGRVGPDTGAAVPDGGVAVQDTGGAVAHTDGHRPRQRHRGRLRHRSGSLRHPRPAGRRTRGSGRRSSRPRRQGRRAGHRRLGPA